MINKLKRIIKLIGVIAIILLLSFNVKKIIKWKKDSNEINNILEKENPKIINKENNKEHNKENNKDIVGWLKVNNTNIDYPFVRHKDNKYYLTHNLNKEKSTAGWIFLDYRNNINLKNKNSIIYGHARKDKTMFGTLKYALKKEWYKNKENQIININIKNKKYKYKIFSIYTIKKENYYLQTEFKEDKEYKNFLNILKRRSIYNFKVDTKKINYILTLSTCYKDDKRVVVHAKLVE